MPRRKREFGRATSKNKVESSEVFDCTRKPREEISSCPTSYVNAGDSQTKPTGQVNIRSMIDQFKIETSSDKTKGHHCRCCYIILGFNEDLSNSDALLEKETYIKYLERIMMFEKNFLTTPKVHCDNDRFWGIILDDIKEVFANPGTELLYRRKGIGFFENHRENMGKQYHDCMRSPGLVFDKLIELGAITLNSEDQKLPAQIETPIPESMVQSQTNETPSGDCGISEYHDDNVSMQYSEPDIIFAELRAMESSTQVETAQDGLEMVKATPEDSRDIMTTEEIRPPLVYSDCNHLDTSSVSCSDSQCSNLTTKCNHDLKSHSKRVAATRGSSHDENSPIKGAPNSFTTCVKKPIKQSGLKYTRTKLSASKAKLQRLRSKKKNSQPIISHRLNQASSHITEIMSNQSPSTCVDSSVSQKVKILKTTICDGLKFYVVTDEETDAIKIIDGRTMVRKYRLVVLNHMLALRSSTDSHGIAIRTWNEMIKNADYLKSYVLRKQPGDPDFEPAPSHIGLKQKFVLPSKHNKFPGCPSHIKEDNEIEKILNHSRTNQLGFHVLFRNYHSSYWLHYQVVMKLNLSPVRRYLFDLGLNSYVKYDKVVKMDRKFTKKVLDVPTDNAVRIDLPVREAVVGLPANVVISATDDKPIGPFEESDRIEAILDRAFPAMSLAFLVKLQNSYRLYWIDGRIAARLGKDVVLEYILTVRRDLNQRAWLKILDDGRYIFREVLRKKLDDFDRPLYHLGDRGKSSTLKAPTPEDSYPGCPGEDPSDNEIYAILDHSFVKQLAFFIEFKNYHGQYWIHYKTLTNLDYKVALGNYLKKSDVAERAQIEKLFPQPILQI